FAQIEYLKAENRALQSRLARQRILFTDAVRRTLGALAREIGIKALRELNPIVSPRPYCVGIDNSWRRNGRFWSDVGQEDRKRQSTLSNSLYGWPVRTRVGVTREFTAPCLIWISRWAVARSAAFSKIT